MVEIFFTQIAEICVFCLAGVIFFIYFFFFALVKMQGDGEMFDQSGREAQGDFKI